jgi:hypothetical protein
MIINNTYGFIFVHVPKSAGTSVTHFLSNFSCYCDLEIGGTTQGQLVQKHYQSRFGLRKHSSSKEIRAVVGDVLWKKYFSFAIVRNPYDRALSAYKFMQKMRGDGSRPGDPLAQLEGADTFSKFVHSPYFETSGLDRMLNPQMFWLRSDVHSTQLNVDFVGKVEELDAAMAYIVKTFTAGTSKPTMVMPVMNRTEKAEAAASYEQELIADPSLEEIIYKRYEVDFTTFNYPRWSGGKKKKPAAAG